MGYLWPISNRELWTHTSLGHGLSLCVRSPSLRQTATLVGFVLGVYDNDIDNDNVGSILHGVDPLSYFSVQPVLHDWCNKGHDMWYPACGMVYIKEPLLLIGKSSPCGSSGFRLSLSEWYFTICPMPYNRK